jgi:aldehyde:ferredoxin oxidoreductase
MGADHTAGLIAMPVPDGARASQDAQIVNAVCDSSGFCQFQQPSMEEMRIYFNAMYGLELTPRDIVQYGWRCLQDEWAFNRKAGLGEHTDALPEWMSTEAIPSNGAVFDVPREELQRVFTLMEFNEEIMSQRASG